MTSMTPGERVPPMGWTAAALTMEPSAFCDPNGRYQRAGPRMGRERAWMGSEQIARAHLVRLSLRAVLECWSPSGWGSTPFACVLRRTVVRLGR